jgi:hypothetical protein
VQGCHAEGADLTKNVGENEATALNYLDKLMCVGLLSVR